MRSVVLLLVGVAAVVALPLQEQDTPARTQAELLQKLLLAKPEDNDIIQDHEKDQQPPSLSSHSSSPSVSQSSPLPLPSPSSSPSPSTSQEQKPNPIPVAQVSTPSGDQGEKVVDKPEQVQENEPQPETDTQQEEQKNSVQIPPQTEEVKEKPIILKDPLPVEPEQDQLPTSYVVDYEPLESDSNPMPSVPIVEVFPLQTDVKELTIEPEEEEMLVEDTDEFPMQPEVDEFPLVELEFDELPVETEKENMPLEPEMEPLLLDYEEEAELDAEFGIIREEEESAYPPINEEPGFLVPVVVEPEESYEQDPYGPLEPQEPEILPPGVGFFSWALPEYFGEEEESEYYYPVEDVPVDEYPMDYEMMSQLSPDTQTALEYETTSLEDDTAVDVVDTLVVSPDNVMLPEVTYDEYEPEELFSQEYFIPDYIVEPPEEEEEVLLLNEEEPVIDLYFQPNDNPENLESSTEDLLPSEDYVIVNEDDEVFPLYEDPISRDEEVFPMYDDMEPVDEKDIPFNEDMVPEDDLFPVYEDMAPEDEVIPVYEDIEPEETLPEVDYYSSEENLTNYPGDTPEEPYNPEMMPPQDVFVFEDEAPSEEYIDYHVPAPNSGDTMEGEFGFEDEPFLPYDEFIPDDAPVMMEQQPHSPSIFSKLTPILSLDETPNPETIHLRDILFPFVNMDTRDMEGDMMVKEYSPSHTPNDMLQIIVMDNPNEDSDDAPVPLLPIAGEPMMPQGRPLPIVEYPIHHDPQIHWPSDHHHNNNEPSFFPHNNKPNGFRIFYDQWNDDVPYSSVQEPQTPFRNTFSNNMMNKHFSAQPNMQHHPPGLMDSGVPHMTDAPHLNYDMHQSPSMTNFNEFNAFKPSYSEDFNFPHNHGPFSPPRPFFRPFNFPHNYHDSPDSFSQQSFIIPLTPKMPQSDYNVFQLNDGPHFRPEQDIYPSRTQSPLKPYHPHYPSGGDTRHHPEPHFTSFHRPQPQLDLQIYPLEMAIYPNSDSSYTNPRQRPPFFPFSQQTRFFPDDMSPVAPQKRYMGSSMYGPTIPNHVRYAPGYP